jgi:hypothetical protein
MFSVDAPVTAGAAEIYVDHRVCGVGPARPVVAQWLASELRQRLLIAHAFATFEHARTRAATNDRCDSPALAPA